MAKAGFIPAGMELFPATSLQQLEFIKRVIDRCDYYVVIVGARYGSLDGDKSFTEKEYEYALSKDIPVLAFIHKNPGKIAAEKTDADSKQAARLDAFRERLKTGRVVHLWTDINDLCMNVLVAVTSEVTLSPGIGWVRGDQAIDPKVLQELEKLRKNNVELTEQLNEITSAPMTFPSHLPSPDSDVELTVTAREPNQLEQNYSYRTTWKAIFLDAIDKILKEKYEGEISNTLGKRYARKFLSNPFVGKLLRIKFAKFGFNLKLWD